MRQVASATAVVVSGLLFLGSGCASAQQSTAMAEKLAGDDTAKLIKQARQQSGLPKLGRIQDARLREQACAHAERDDESATIADGFFREKVGTISYVLYSTPDPRLPAPELLQWAGARAGAEQHGWTSKRFAVGVCFMHTAKHPEGRYWVCASKYMGAIKSFSTALFGTES